MNVKYGMHVRIASFSGTADGPEGTWRGRPRKGSCSNLPAKSPPGRMAAQLEIWGDWQRRAPPYTYVDDHGRRDFTARMQIRVLQGAAKHWLAPICKASENSVETVACRCWEKK
jgi:hypothetical protein